MKTSWSWTNAHFSFRHRSKHHDFKVALPRVSQIWPHRQTVMCTVLQCGYMLYFTQQIHIHADLHCTCVQYIHFHFYLHSYSKVFISDGSPAFLPLLSSLVEAMICDKHPNPMRGKELSHIHHDGNSVSLNMHPSI